MKKVSTILSEFPSVVFSIELVKIRVIVLSLI